MERPWSYEQNTFLNVTEGNNVLMYELSNQHYESMRAQEADPYFKELANGYQPLWQEFNDNFGNRQMSGGTQKGDTLSVDQQLAMGAKNLAKWEPFILQIFPKGTPGYMKIFPNNHYPFTQGKKEMRIKAYETLSKTLAGIPQLAQVQGEALTYWKQLDEQRNMQQQSMNNTGNSAARLETSRVNCADKMYADLGSLMNPFYKDRHQITLYFDLEKIRKHEQLIFERKVKPLTSLFVVKHTFAATDMLTFMNKGVKPLYFYFGTSKTTPFSEADSIAVAPNDKVMTDAGKMGAPAKTYLFVYNPDEIAEGNCEIDFM